MALNKHSLLFHHLYNFLFSIIITIIIVPKLLTIFINVVKSNNRNLNLPPSPRKLPIIGNLHQLGTSLFRSFNSLSQKHGSLMFLHLGHTPTLVVSSAKVLKELMKNHDLAFSDRFQTAALRILMYRCTDVGFANYGQDWKQKRKIFVLELLNPRMMQSISFIREEEVTRLVSNLHEEALTNTSDDVNLSEMILDTLNSIICKCSLGCNTQDYRYDIAKELARKVIIQHAVVTLGDHFPWLRWVDVLRGQIQEFKATFGAMDALLDEVITKHKKVRREIIDDNQSNYEKDFVDILIQLQEDGSRHHELSNDDIKAIIVRHLAPRMTSTNVKLKGFDIPAKTLVCVNAWGIQSDPEFWEKPEEFIPERHENRKVNYNGQDSQFIAFGFGRRGCPGMSFGLDSAEYLLANLLHCFNWKMPSQGIDMTEANALISSKRVPLRLKPIPFSFK